MHQTHRHVRRSGPNLPRQIAQVLLELVSARAQLRDQMRRMRVPHAPHPDRDVDQGLRRVRGRFRPTAPLQRKVQRLRLLTPRARMRVMVLPQRIPPNAHDPLMRLANRGLVQNLQPTQRTGDGNVQPQSGLDSGIGQGGGGDFLPRQVAVLHHSPEEQNVQPMEDEDYLRPGGDDPGIWRQTHLRFLALQTRGPRLLGREYSFNKTHELDDSALVGDDVEVVELDLCHSYALRLDLCQGEFHDDQGLGVHLVHPHGNRVLG